ncbi:MAG: hypothetical protein K6F86_05240 [Lachnospiraceae bacterium]|nr:hypothetical protein [Lachnospiraceae bacterium]
MRKRIRRDLVLLLCGAMTVNPLSVFAAEAVDQQVLETQEEQTLQEAPVLQDLSSSGGGARVVLKISLRHRQKNNKQKSPPVKAGGKKSLF